tara:strand:- start:902 stop:1084 length:183 start_codon:yes stop_codon:yes gene_type:complete
MRQEEQSIAFAEDLNKLINRYVDEFDLTYESYIGVLTLAIHQLISQTGEEGEEGKEEKEF